MEVRVLARAAAWARMVDGAAASAAAWEAWAAPWEDMEPWEVAAMAPGNSQAEVPVPAPMLTARLIWARQRVALTLPPVSPPDGVTLQLSNRPQHLAAVRFHLACDLCRVYNVMLVRNTLSSSSHLGRPSGKSGAPTDL